MSKQYRKGPRPTDARRDGGSERAAEGPTVSNQSLLEQLVGQAADQQLDRERAEAVAEVEHARLVLQIDTVESDRADRLQAIVENSRLDDAVKASLVERLTAHRLAGEGVRDALHEAVGAHDEAARASVDGELTALHGALTGGEASSVDHAGSAIGRLVRALAGIGLDDEDEEIVHGDLAGEELG